MSTIINPNNQALIDLLDDWFSDPDNMGEEFWRQYEEELQAICL